MLFNSYIFLFVFLPLTISLYVIAPIKRKNLILTFASFLFYGYWNYKLCGLLLFSIVVNFFLGSRIYLSANRSAQKRYLIAVTAVNLGILGFFKYANFFIDSLNVVFPALNAGTLNIVLPIGISFFTFQGMSYSFDIYRNKTRPVAHFIDFACYISMFPQLVAGPIVRFSQIANQLSSRVHSAEKAAQGLRRFIVGLAKKVLVADTLAFVVDQHLYAGPVDGWSVWVGITAFSLQIYFDFSGYSDMAIGLGSIFGFELPENFNQPYRARGVYDFWKRWHMTLSGWLRDYLYIPLGGSRCATPVWMINIMITFLLCGLWHGAAWTFVGWGGYFGLLIIIERPFRERIKRASSWVVIPVTNFFVLIGWVFFKAGSFAESLQWLRAMFGLGGAQMGSFSSVAALALVVVFQVSCWFGFFRPKRIWLGSSWSDAALIAVFVLCFVSIMGVDVSPFLYYQF